MTASLSALLPTTAFFAILKQMTDVLLEWNRYNCTLQVFNLRKNLSQAFWVIGRSGQNLHSNVIKFGLKKKWSVLFLSFGCVLQGNVLQSFVSALSSVSAKSIDSFWVLEFLLCLCWLLTGWLECVESAMNEPAEEGIGLQEGSSLQRILRAHWEAVVFACFLKVSKCIESTWDTLWPCQGRLPERQGDFNPWATTLDFVESREL